MIESFVLFSAFVFTIANRLYSKYVLFKLDGFALAHLTNLLCAIFILPFLFYFYPEFYKLSFDQYVLIIILGALWTYVAWLGNLSIAQNDFSFKEVIRQTRVIWVVLVGVFFLGEQLTFTNFLGIFLIILSVFVVSYKNISFKEHVSPGPVLLAWSVALVAALITILEKLAVTNIPIPIYAFFAYLLPAIFLSLFFNTKKINDTKNLFNNNKFEIVVCSLLMILSYFSALYAYKWFPISFVYPLIQSSTIFGIIVGSIYFEDRKNMNKKILAGILAILGVIILKLW